MGKSKHTAKRAEVRSSHQDEPRSPVPTVSVSARKSKKGSDIHKKKHKRCQKEASISPGAVQVMEDDTEFQLSNSTPVPSSSSSVADPPTSPRRPGAVDVRSSPCSKKSKELKAVQGQVSPPSPIMETQNPEIIRQSSEHQLTPEKDSLQTSLPSSIPFPVPQPSSPGAHSTRHEKHISPKKNHKLRLSEPSSAPLPFESSSPGVSRKTRSKKKGKFSMIDSISSVPTSSRDLQGDDDIESQKHLNDTSQNVSPAQAATPQVDAELVPNNDDVAARVTDQLGKQMVSQWQDRINEVVQSQLKEQRQKDVIVDAVAVEKESLPRLRFYVLAGLCLLVAGGIIGGVIAAKSRDDPIVATVAPTVIETLAPNPRRDYLLETLGSRIAPSNTTEEWSILMDQLTPQGQAIRWMSENDEYTAEPELLETGVLLERYALSVLYFSTSGPEWLSNPSFLNETLSTCQWNNGVTTTLDGSKGVICNDYSSFPSVSYVSLDELNLHGSLPWEISLLENLVGLYLSYNTITGSIPSQIGALTKLKDLWLRSNSVTGQLPSTMPASMQDLLLTNNFISGTLVSEWVDTMPNIESLSLGLNNLHGSIPYELGNWKYVEAIDLEGSSLTGSIPTSIGLWTRMEYLYMEYNELTGTIPTEVGDMGELKYLFVRGNSELTGTVPEEIGSLDNLEAFLFEGTSLTGSVDSIFCEEDNPPALQGDCLGDSPTIECSCCSFCCLPETDTCEWMT